MAGLADGHGTLRLIPQLARAVGPANHYHRRNRDSHPEPDALPKSRGWVAQSDRVNRPARDCDATAVTRRRAGERHAADGVGRNHQRVPPQRTTLGPHLRLLPPGQGPGRERRGAPPGTAAGLEQGECDVKGLQTQNPLCPLPRAAHVLPFLCNSAIRALTSRRTRADGGGFVSGNRMVPFEVSYPLRSAAWARLIAAVIG